jgi:hypothetical protein
LLLEVATNALGWVGVALIVYGITVAVTGETWKPVEAIVHPVSSALTFIATAMTAASVYLSPHAATPEPISKIIVAPMAIGACVIALGFLIWMDIPEVIVSGFAIVGLAGGLFRLRPKRGHARRGEDSTRTLPG